MNIATPTATITASPVKANKGFGTGKGTTAKIKEVMAQRAFSYTSDEIASDIGVPSRQISKRLAELVQKGYLAVEKVAGRNEYRRNGI